MIWIEFMGPSGIGKSYWFRKIMNIHAPLLPQDLLVRRAAEKGLFKTGPLKIRFLGMLYSLQIDRVKPRLTHHLFQTVEKLAGFGFDNADQAAITAFFSGIESAGLTPVTKLKLCEFFMHRLRQHKTYELLLKPDDPFFSEDGIAHANWGIGQALEEVRLPDVVFYLQASDNYILENRKRRIKSGRGTFVESNMEPAELAEYTSLNNRKYQDRVTLLIQQGVRVVSVNVEQRPEVVFDVFEREIMAICPMYR